jgi:hypothetical protein
MEKLAIVAIAATLLVSGLVITGHAVAQNRGWVQAPIGEPGAKWGNQCWKGKEGYFGYWGECAKGPKAAPKAAKGAKAAPKS